jgi:peptidoglycan/xylan/chitin deacetylase (PgdA/CDA1 family)/glycosyltransferase involved in cell wall biosynthesis
VSNAEASVSPIPRVSVVIATYQRRELVLRAVARLLVQTAPLDAFEVVVVVDGSSDGTAEALRLLKTPFSLRVFEQPNRGQAAALNRGVQESRAPVCLFLDDDTEIGEEGVARHLAVQERAGVVAVGRLVTSAPPWAAPIARAMARALNDHYTRLAGRPPTWADCYGSNTSMPRAAFLEAGGLREDLLRSYDTELGLRLADSGMQVLYIPDAVAVQRFVKTAAAVVRDLIDDGVSDVAIWRHHPRVLSKLKLGHHGETPPRARALRLFLQPFLGTPRGLASLDALMGRTPLAQRWSGVVGDACYWRGVRQAAGRHEWNRLRRTVPILLYHAIAAPGERASRYVVPPSRLARQMWLLRILARRPIALSEYVADQLDGKPSPARSVVVTFDDGFADVVERGLPVLRRARVSATLFVVTGRVGATADWDDRGSLAGRAMANRALLDRWLDNGMELGAHTRTHRRLSDLESDAVDAELRDSKCDLEELFGRKMELFAYPYGAISDHVRDSVARVGYAAACGVRPGVNSSGTSLHELRRVEVDGRASFLRFALALLGRDAVLRGRGGD